MLWVCKCVLCDREWDCGWTYDMSSGWLSLEVRQALFRAGPVNSLVSKCEEIENASEYDKIYQYFFGSLCEWNNVFKQIF